MALPTVPVLLNKVPHREYNTDMEGTRSAEHNEYLRAEIGP